MGSTPFCVLNGFSVWVEEPWGYALCIELLVGSKLLCNSIEKYMIGKENLINDDCIYY